jgi:hypothetical protein
VSAFVVPQPLVAVLASRMVLAAGVRGMEGAEGFQWSSSIFVVDLGCTT